MTQVGHSVFYVKGMSYSFGRAKGKLVICYDEKKKLDITQSRRLKLLEVQKLKKENKKSDKAMPEIYDANGKNKI